MLLRIVEGVRDVCLSVLGFPLLRPGRALYQLPFIFEQVLEEVVAPLRGCLRPCDFRASGNGVGADTGAMFALPDETLILERTSFRCRSHQRWVSGAVRLAEGMPAGDQRDGFLVVHRHAEEGFANIPRRGDRIGIAVRTFRIDVDETHLHRAERLCELALATVTFVAEPAPFRTPIELLGLPHVGAATGEAERFEAHRLQRDVAGQHHQVGPGNLPAKLLLDRPQQSPRLVEIGIVRPRIEWREALLPCTSAAATIGDAVGARSVPGQADHQTAVVSEIGRPPVLRYSVITFWRSLITASRSRFLNSFA